ncbi:MAG: mechanosensitive ion channel protein MscS [Chloroflexi bacterium]|nr:MAG: mechanosensitive ion channel protein MscS [Chloroflexota bacterium]
MTTLTKDTPIAGCPPVEEELHHTSPQPGVRMKLVTAVAAMTIILAVVGGTVAAAIFVPQAAIYVPILALGLALALQKYIASFFGYFAISFAHIYDVGDRIRIGNIKGDVRRVGLLHTTLEEVGEDEKLGGELTGRIIHLPNLLVLDQAVLNYSKDYASEHKTILSDYMFDEVRIPITPDSNVERACHLLERILTSEDEPHIRQARRIFRNGHPRFLAEASQAPRVLVSVEPQRIWIKGKFVTPLRGRNDLRTKILLRFLKEADNADIRLA